MTVRGPSLAAAILGLVVFAPPAQAATFPASCSGTTGDAASLQTAITSANTATGPDSVRLGQGCIYTLLLSDNGWYGIRYLHEVFRQR